MKKRGLRRYYNKLEDEAILSNLDFSGGENSWFDFYHIHIDDLGLGNKSWRSRKQHLDALFSIAKRVEEKLLHFPKDFQYWIMIDENDSREDCIYIHTENPNGSLFPTDIDHNENAKSINEKLLEYISEKDYEVIKGEYVDYEDKLSTTYFLYKPTVGLKLLKP